MGQRSEIEEARARAEDLIAEARREAERRISDVRGAVQGELGFLPKKKPLLLALAAGAGGFALAFALRRRRRPARPRRLRD